MAKKKTTKTTTATTTNTTPPSAPAKPQSAPVTASAIRFEVNPGLPEVQDYARRQGWAGKGWTELSIPWQELVYTTDGWKTQNTLKKSESSSQQTNGHFLIPGVPAGTQVEFALHVGIASQAPSDAAGYRERGDLWLNNGGGNYRQTTA